LGIKCADSIKVSTHPSTAHPSFGLSARRLGCVRALAALGLGLCCYLFVMTLMGSEPLGCNPVTGCGKALAGRWSAWFGMPISLPAAGVYLAILISARCVKSEDRTWRLRYSGRSLAATTAMAAISGAWLLWVQFASGKNVCGYCLCVHCCGLLSAGLVWQRLRRWSRQLLTPAGAGLVILILGQAVVFRHPYGVRAGAIANGTRRPTPADRHLRITAGGRLFDLDAQALPTLGSPTANHFIVVLSDYTCEHCRLTHRTLERSGQLFSNQVGVIVLPVLLDPAANPYLPPGVTNPLPQDAALTRIALAVFCVKPTAFAEINRWLFAEDRVRGEAETRAYAEQLVGPETLRSAERDPRIRQMILTGCELFARGGSGAIPKMLIGSTEISGAVEDAPALAQVVQREWGIQPTTGR